MPHVHLNKTTSPNGKSYWQARWTAPDGSRRSKGLGDCSEVSKAEATRKCRDIEQNDARVSSSDTVGGFIEKYVAAMPDTGHTKNVKRCLARMADFVGTNTRLVSVRPVHAEDFAASLEGDRATVAKYVGVARTFFDAAYRRELVARNPFGGVAVRVPRKDFFVRTLTPDEFSRILDACPTPAWRCSFALCKWAGLRAGEARRVKWTDIDFAGCTLAVNATSEQEQVKVHTTKRHERRPPIRPELKGELLACHEWSQDDGPCPLSEHTDPRRARVIVMRAGVGDYGPPLQSLRRQCRVEWEEKYPTMAVNVWMGHGTATAQRFYYRPSPELVSRVTECERGGIAMASSGDKP